METRKQFSKSVDLSNRNEMISFLNNHPATHPHSEYKEMWTIANNIGFMYTIPMRLHPIGFEAITDYPKDAIDKLISGFKFDTGFKYGAYRADYNDNILLLMPRVEFGKVRGVKITNFDTVPYTECSIDFLQRRVKLICQFDGLCDNIVSEYYNMISKFKKEVCKYGK